MLLACILAPNSVRAQYYSINIDTKTIEEMVAAFAAEEALEAEYNEQVQYVKKHYSYAEVATAGIYSAKWLERRALTNLGKWSSSTENYYYQRIYSMVKDKIMPKIFTVAGMMIKSPLTAIYWGSYLYKICAEVKSLCMEFESVVTNGSLSFSDIAFLEFTETFAQLFDICHLQMVNMDDFFDSLVSMGESASSVTLDNLIKDFTNIPTLANDVINGGLSSAAWSMGRNSSFYDVFSNILSTLSDKIANNYSGYFDALPNMTKLTNLANASSLFTTGKYDLSAWTSDYLLNTAGTYYTQRWYIYWKDQGSLTLCDYTPSTNSSQIQYGDEWIRYDVGESLPTPTDAEKELILQNSESQAGWSRSMVDKLNKQSKDTVYSITYKLMDRYITENSKLIQVAFAYSITVTASWDIMGEEVYEDVFDSYSMDLDTFLGQMNARLTSYNENETTYVYYLDSDERQYYQTTSAAKMEGVEAVTISATCNDSVILAEGTSQYKCNQCGSSLSDHTKECSMRTTLTDDGIDVSELNENESELQRQISSLQSQIDALEDENSELLKLISTSSIADAEIYRQQYNSNKSEIDSLTSELEDLEQQLSDVQAAIEEAKAGEEEETDDYRRIPGIMQECQTAYSLTWEDEGYWDGYTYIRHATMPNIDGIITFSAELSVARKPKYFLGIKIHRAIIQIAYKLTIDYTETSIVDVITLDGSLSDDAKATLVNERMSAVAQEYPDCEITTEYAKSDGVDEETGSDVKHLLWASDRLQMAREIDSRLTRIYADLVSLEKMMHYKRNIIDVLKDVSPYMDTDQGRKLNVLQECHKRWINRAKGITDDGL